MIKAAILTLLLIVFCTSSNQVVLANESFTAMDDKASSAAIAITQRSVYEYSQPLLVMASGALAEYSASFNVNAAKTDGSDILYSRATSGAPKKMAVALFRTGSLRILESYVDQPVDSTTSRTDEIGFYQLSIAHETSSTEYAGFAANKRLNKQPPMSNFIAWDHQRIPSPETATMLYALARPEEAAAASIVVRNQRYGISKGRYQLYAEMGTAGTQQFAILLEGIAGVDKLPQTTDLCEISVGGKFRLLHMESRKRDANNQPSTIVKVEPTTNGGYRVTGYGQRKFTPGNDGCIDAAFRTGGNNTKMFIKQLKEFGIELEP